MIEVKAVTIGALPDAAALLAKAQEASVQALVVWSRAPGGIGIRFTPAAFAAYGFTPRSHDYAQKHPSPFVASGRFEKGVLSGSGCHVDTKSTQTTFTTTLVVPAARGLNFKAKFDTYRQEWSRFYRSEATTVDQAAQAGIDKAGKEWANG